MTLPGKPSLNGAPRWKGEVFAPRNGAQKTSPDTDFWLTRNGHGAGFWDGDRKAPHSDKLTELSKSFGQVDLFVGDDSRIYA